MVDVLIAGAGPAGSIAALVLARSGARVLIVDRATFPRDKLCGDTLNPGAVRLLTSIGLEGGPLAPALRLRGMRITGPHAEVTARYPGQHVGLAVVRRDLDAWLLNAAIAAGAHFEPGLTVRAPLFDDRAFAPLVRGLVLARRGAADLRLPALVTIGADGRRSTVARALQLVVSPPRPRRWAFGTYVEGVDGLGDVGEMHIRGGLYVGIAPVAPNLANVCLVTGRRQEGRTPLEILTRVIGNDRGLAPRFARAQFDHDVRVLGPLACEARAVGVEGALLAGDAAGFVDPMTGDGLHLAMRSAMFAADAARHAIETGDFRGAIDELTRARAAAFARKLRFNRALRALVESPRAVDMAGWGAKLMPGLVSKAVRYAGDAA